MHEVLVNRLGGLSLPRKSVVRLTDHPDMTLDVYRGQINKSTTFIGGGGGGGQRICCPPLVILRRGAVHVHICFYKTGI